MNSIFHDSIRMRHLPVACAALLAAAAMTSCTKPAADKAAGTTAPKTYPRAELLIEPAVLAQAPAGEFAILDVRSQKSFDEGRIPGAVRVDEKQWAKTFGDGADAKAWSERIGKLGIEPGSKVIVYDDALFRNAARIWWILRYWGVADARLLDGGWQGWQSAGLPVEHNAAQSPVPKSFDAVPHPERLAAKAQLLDSLQDHSLQIVDARSDAEFTGVDKHKNKRAGHVPTAKHLEWLDLIDQKTHRFKPPDQLAALFRQAGIVLDRPTATYCQSGGRAAVMVFALDLMGATRTANYCASWHEWGNEDDTPIVVEPPEDKKSAAAPKGNEEEQRNANHH